MKGEQKMDNMNNGMMGGPNPTMGGYNYQGMNQPMQKHGNVLSNEQIKSLQQKQQQFSLALTQEEYLRAVCNHRNMDGTGDTLVYDPETGEATCTICGYRFRPIEPNVTPAEIKEDVDRIVDILQTIKLMYVDLPPEAAKDYFPVIALIEKVPQLFEFAAKNMAKHEIYNWQYSNKNMGAFNMFNNLQNMFSGGYQQPMYGGMPQGNPQPYMNPYMNNGGYGAPMPNPALNNPNMMGGNGFGYPGASQQSTPQMNPQMVSGGGYSPTTNGFQFVPGQNPNMVNPAQNQGNPGQQVASAPEAPKTEETSTVTQNVTV